MGMLFSSWPWLELTLLYAIDLRILKTYLHTKMILLHPGIQKFEHDTQTATECITTWHLRAVIRNIIVFVSLNIIASFLERLVSILPLWLVKRRYFLYKECKKYVVGTRTLHCRVICDLYHTCPDIRAPATTCYCLSQQQEQWYLQNAFSRAAATIWNSLPHDIHVADSFSDLRSHCILVFTCSHFTNHPRDRPCPRFVGHMSTYWCIIKNIY